MLFSLFAHASLVSFLILKRTVALLDEDLTLLTLFNLNYIFKCPNFRKRSYWKLGLQYTNFGGDTIQSITLIPYLLTLPCKTKAQLGRVITFHNLENPLVGSLLNIKYQIFLGILHSQPCRRTASSSFWPRCIDTHMMSR